MFILNILGMFCIETLLILVPFNLYKIILYIVIEMLYRFFKD
jgi:hypothetical protein